MGLQLANDIHDYYSYTSSMQFGFVYRVNATERQHLIRYSAKS